MTADEARRLLELSRRAQWRYPSSAGSPVRADEDAWVEPLLAEQEAFAAAARFLVEQGDQEDATELAAKVWRLWMVSRDIDDGRAFLGPVLERNGEPPRARALALYGDSLFAFWRATATARAGGARRRSPRPLRRTTPRHSRSRTSRSAASRSARASTSAHVTSRCGPVSTLVACRRRWRKLRSTRTPRRRV